MSFFDGRRHEIMRGKTLSLALVCLLLSLVLVACGSPESEPPETTPPANADTSVAPSGETDYGGLGLTEDEIRMLEERGIANVDSAEVASKIAGFEVAVPAYVPDGFQPGKFSISISGAGLPESMRPKFNNTKVQRVYTRQEDRDIMILLIQSPQQFGIGGGEPAEICGQTGERSFSPADPANGQPYDKLTLGWEKNGVYYALTGTLTGTLDEAEMEKIACSIGVE
jgi:hypothetical protein